MKTLTVKLETIDSVKKFNYLATRQNFDIDIVSGRYNVDAKSLMGIFSLNLMEPIKVVLHTDDKEKIAEIEKELSNL